MSFDALAWAGKQRPGSAARKLVLFALADRHNTEEDLAWPSLGWTCDWTGLNRKTVISALQALERTGLISDSGRRLGATGQIKAYRLHLESVPKTEPFQKRNRSDFSAKESQKRDTEPVREPVRKEASASSLSASAFPPPDGVPGNVWEDYLALRKAKRARMSPTAYDRQTAALKRLDRDGYPPGEVVAQSVERGWIGFFELKGNGNGLGDVGKSATAFAGACHDSAGQPF